MKAVSSKVPSHLKEEIDEYAEELGESRSIAIRQLLRDGLEQKRQSVPFNHAVAWIGSLMVASLFTPASPSLARLLGITGMLLFVGGLSWPMLRSRLAPFIYQLLRG